MYFILEVAVNAVSLEFIFKTTLVLENDIHEPEIRFWRDDMKDQFIDNINMKSIHDINIKLHNFSEEHNKTKDGLDNILKEISDLFVNNSKTVFGYSYKAPQQNNENKYPTWFGRECKEAVKVFVILLWCFV